jgi:hypothetical protein
MMSVDEEILIEMWHIDQFDRQGFDGMQTATLLLWGIDPHATEELLSRGCPPDTALRILQPVGAQSHAELEAESITVVIH